MLELFLKIVHILLFCDLSCYRELCSGASGNFSVLSESSFIGKCCFWALFKMGFMDCIGPRHRWTPERPTYFDANDQGEKQLESFFILLKSWPLQVLGLL